ncbi:CpaE family protein [Pendulispora albinea]|uniref:AAA family ATPase n=1 Tax=Pendulispora albinea TaxID=2741071 RepID=A0ABZ2LQS0_9BACT
MSELPTVVVLGASRERYARAKSALTGTAFVSRELGTLAMTKGRIVIVDLAGDLERGLRMVEEVRRVIANVQIIALAEDKDPDVILRAMRAGACEFALFREGQGLADVVKPLLRREAAARQGGTIVSLFPAKGGVGATTLAVNLACALCRKDARVLLVDLDRQLGDVLAFLDMAPRGSMADIVKNLHRLDRELLLSSLARHASGPFVVAQADALAQEDGEPVAPAQITALLQLAARHFDWVVCDGLRGFDESSVAVLDASNHVELVLTQDVIALRNAKYRLDLLQRLGYEKDKVGLVINRYHPRGSIDPGSMAENLGFEVRSTIADDPGAASAAMNRGIPLAEVAPRSKAVSDMTAFAARLSGAGEVERGGFFRALFRRLESPRPVTDSAEKKGEGYDVARRSPEAT